MSDALKKQIDGTHYKDMDIQPWEIIEKNKLDYFEGAALKYLLRWRVKDGMIDLDKIIHYVERIKELAQKGHYDFISNTGEDILKHRICLCKMKLHGGYFVIENPKAPEALFVLGNNIKSTPYEYCCWCGLKINKD